MTWLRRFLGYSFRLRRVEYRVAELPIFFIPMLLTVKDPELFRSSLVWEGLCLFLFLFAVGDLVNCWADRDLDAVYKPHLSQAVDWLTPAGVLTQAALSALASLALSLHVAWVYGRWLLPPVVLLGNLLAWAYSAPPLRLKGRGVWQLAFYWGGLFVCPMLLAALVFCPFPSRPVWAVALAYGFLQTGVILVNTAEDFPEDRAEGVRTIVVALGIPNSMAVASLFSSLGGAWLLHTYAQLFAAVGASQWGLVPLGVGVLWVTHEFSSLWRQMVGAPEEEQIRLARARGPLCPLWITSVALSSLWAAVLYFLKAANL